MYNQTSVLQASVGFYCAFVLDIGLWILAMFIPHVQYSTVNLSYFVFQQMYPPGYFQTEQVEEIYF